MRRRARAHAPASRHHPETRSNGAAGVAFVGGALVPRGGHNLLEAARAPGGCALLHGPHIESMAGPAEEMARTRPPAARRVDGGAELAAAVGELLGDGDLRARSRAAAAGVAAALERGLLEETWRTLRGPLNLPDDLAASSRSSRARRT